MSDELNHYRELQPLLDRMTPFAKAALAAMADAFAIGSCITGRLVEEVQRLLRVGSPDAIQAWSFLVALRPLAEERSDAHLVRCIDRWLEVVDPLLPIDQP